LSVIGVLVREKAMLAKAGMKTVSEVQNLVLRSLLSLTVPQGMHSILVWPIQIINFNICPSPHISHAVAPISEYSRTVMLPASPQL
jgi:hypothetical protein